MVGTTVALSSAVISNTGAAIAAFELVGAAFYLAKATLQYVRLTKELAGDTILFAVAEGKRVLIVVNTVRQCQELA